MLGRQIYEKEKADRAVNILFTDAAWKDYLGFIEWLFRFANRVSGEMFIALASISLKTA
jgi:hypothetical protein